MRRRIAIITFVLHALAAHPAGAAETSRLALVIGNSAYVGLPPLQACFASMNVVAASLKRAGFDVTERLNPSNGAMGAALGAFGDAVAAAPGSVAVVYVCGYATQFDGRVFLLPASARLERDTDALTQGMLARLLLGSVADPALRTGLLLLDSVALPGKGGAVPPDAGLGTLPAGVGLVGTYSQATPASGPTTLATTLASAMAAPDVEATELLLRVRTALDGASGLSAMIRPPERTGNLTGGPPPAPPPPALPAIVAVPAPPPPVVEAPASPPAPAPAPAPLVSPSVTGPDPTAPAVMGEVERRDVQAALLRLGYYAGRADGVIGPETLAAIRRFQHEAGAEMTGRLTVGQASRLLAGSK